MSLFKKVRDGQISIDAFERQLNAYEVERLELQRNAGQYGAELFKSKMRDIDMSISMIQIFIDKFDEIKVKV